MKKILTLFTMLLVTASTLLAQAPSLSYQMIVRNQKTADVTVGEKVFHTNDLIYSQPMDVYAAVVEANGNVAKVWAFIGNANSNSGNGMIAQQVTTNMNGMLSLTLNDYESVELPADYSVPATVGAQVNLKPFKAINWKDAKIVVAIPEYGIMDTMDILPVPYAYNVYTDSSITTERIVRYIDEKAKATSADSIFNAAEANNDGFMAPAQTRVVNILKQNPDMVKDLAIYFLHTVTEDDVQSAYNALDAAPNNNIDYIADKVADYTKTHKAAVYDVVKYYLEHATVNDANNLWNAAMNMQNGDDNVDTIIYMIVDSVNKYIAKNKQWIKDVAKYVVSHVEIDDINGMQTLFKTSNNATYEYMKFVLDSLINDYLVKNHYATTKCGDEIITICQMKAQIDQFREYGTKVCPSFGDNNTSTFPNVTTPITLSADVTLSTNPQDYWYELTFPGTNYPATVVSATLNGNSISANLSTYANRTVTFRPVMKQKCMDVTTYGSYTTVPCTLNVTNACEKPEIASFTKTGTSVAELASNHGVALTAKLTNKYYGNDMHYGFRYKVDDATEWVPMSHIVTSTDGLTFSDTIKMDLCGKNITVQAYVTVGDYTDSEELTFKLRDIWLDVTPENPVVNQNMTATNHIAISTETYAQELGTYEPSVEQIVANYGSEFGVNVVPTYKWNNVEVPTGNVFNATAPGEYTVTCSFSIFNSAPCVLTKKVTVQ